MKRYLKQSGIVLAIVAVFGLSFGVARAEGGLLGSLVTFSADTVGYLISYPLEILSAALATVLSIAGTLLDATIKLSLDTSWYTNPATNAIITLGWGIIRDFFNLTFIFILLYNGIRIILDLDQSSQAKKIATEVLIAALLINFSLFFAQLIMDGSNMLAVGLYNSIQTVVTRAGAGSISEAINVTFANQALLNLNPLSFDGFNKFINVILRIIFSGISIYVFISVSFLFIGRFVAFFLLMITSPVWIAGKLVPRLSSYQKKFEETLFDQAMLAPLFLFFLYIILQVITSDIFVAISASGSDIPGGGTNKTGQVMVFAILVALLLIAKSEAKKLSGEIGSTVSGAIGTGLGFAAGGVGILGRFAATSKLGQSAIGSTAKGLNNAVGAGASRINSLTGKYLPTAVGSKIQISPDTIAKATKATSAVTSYIADGAKTGTYDVRRATLPGAGKILEKVTGVKNVGGLFKKAGADMGDTKSPDEIAREKRKEAEERIKDAAKKKREEDNKALNTYVSDTTRTPDEIRNAVEGMDKDQFKSIDPKVFVQNVFAARSLNKAQLQKLQENSMVTQKDRAAIREHIEKPAGTFATPTAAFVNPEADQFMSTGPGRALWQ
ncbi:MAG: hypothetical protein RLZZ347_651 [Candidatus Parcubacteria bacterium]|jgi:hypothetical protein